MKILLAVDGSRYSEAAVEFLSRFPFARPPEVSIVHVCLVPDLHALGHDVTADINRLVDEYRADGERLLAQTKSQCRNWCGKVTTALITGHPAREIVVTAEKEGVDLIVVGSRGMGGMQRFLMGSASEHVAMYAPCSVLVVRTSEADAPLPASNILIADDGSAAADQAVLRFAHLPLGEQREVTLLSVQESFEHFGVEYSAESSPLWRKHQEHLQEHLRQAAEELRAATPHVGTAFRMAPHAANEILTIAAERAVNLIVMGNTGKSVWERMLLGSVSKMVLRHAHCSVWIERVKYSPAAST